MLDRIRMPDRPLVDAFQNATSDELHLHYSRLARTGPPRVDVLVVGMHNSGTSIVAEVLETLGIFMSKSMGHWENFLVTRIIHDGLLFGDAGWADTEILDSVASARSTGIVIRSMLDKYWSGNVALLMALSRHDTRQRGIGLKDPRITVLWEHYAAIFPRARWVIVDRDPEELSTAIARRYKQSVGRGSTQAYRELTAYYRSCFAPIERSQECLTLSYAELLEDPLGTVSRLSDFILAPEERDPGVIARAAGLVVSTADAEAAARQQ